jgi:hypothetical protein
MLPGKAERRRRGFAAREIPRCTARRLFEPQRFRPQDRESRLRVADEILLRDARARPKRVAAEEDVATKDPPLCAGEKNNSPALRRDPPRRNNPFQTTRGVF